MFIFTIAVILNNIFQVNIFKIWCSSYNFFTKNVSNILNNQQQVDMIVFLFYLNVSTDCSYAETLPLFGKKMGQIHFVLYFRVIEYRWKELNFTADPIFELLAVNAKTLGLPTQGGGICIPCVRRENLTHKRRLADIDNMLPSLVFSSWVYRITVFPSLPCSQLWSNYCVYANGMSQN